jgi:hypothetical protein
VGQRSISGAISANVAAVLITGGQQHHVQRCLEIMTTATPAEMTAWLIDSLKHAVAYENSTERQVAENGGMSKLPYMPACRDAYVRMVDMLERSPDPTACASAIHAEMLSVFSNPIYGGVQTQFICSVIDQWLLSLGYEAERLYQVWYSHATSGGSDPRNG